MSYTDRQKSFIDEFRTNWALKNKHPDGVKIRHQNPRTWSATQRDAYNRELARYISTNPQIFDPQHIEGAELVQLNQLEPKAEFGFIEAVRVFTDEATDQAERINPLSSANFGKTFLILGLAVIGAGVAFGYMAANKSIPAK